MIANVDQRALGAVRPMDPATGSAVTRPLNVRAEGARFIRNRSGLYVIRSAPGFREYTKTFRLGDATPAPAAELEITISDPMGHYLPRRVAIQLPRDPDPAA
ncbi:MAG: hypothetical protein GY859_20225, partial [Desulfobacterales bacterium]|nr:hypothetical protein [Desulfobacterales bacterium]